jgi:ABC-2 type transport system permease protein
MKLYFKYVSLLLKSQLQYKTSFFITAAAQFFMPFALFGGIYFLFQRFGNIQGWTLYEVFLCYSVIGVCFSCSTCFARGFDILPNLIKNATFDRILVRPRGTVLQVLGSGFDLKRVGHFLQSLIALIIALIGIDISWSFAKVFTLVNMLICGGIIFTGVYMLQAAVSFWTIDALEFANIFTHGIKEHASYPLSVFPKWITVFFTFIVPFGTINYLPLQYLLGKTDGAAWLIPCIPLAGALFILPCARAWRYGVSKYSSAGS